jgi:hypothetical protein
VGGFFGTSLSSHPAFRFPLSAAFRSVPSERTDNAFKLMSVDIWRKVDFELQPAEVQPVAAQAPSERSIDWMRLKAYWRWRRPLLDVVATILWLYALLKVFVADVDTDVVGHREL